MHISFDMRLAAADDRYLHACARIRRISTTRLLSRVLRTVLADQLVLAVLDDASRQPAWLPGEHGRSHYTRDVRYDLT